MYHCRGALRLTASVCRLGRPSQTFGTGSSSHEVDQGLIRGPCHQQARPFHVSVPAFNKKDLYDILGVKKGATQSEIKKAYYKLAKEHHPDANRNNPNASKKFAEIAEAYDILGTEDKRRDYDSGGGEFGSGAGGASSGHYHQNAQDIFRRFHEQFAGGGMGFESTDQSLQVHLSFLEAALGCNKTVSVKYDEMCKRCKGQRSEPGTKTVKCKTCKGTGEIAYTVSFFQMRDICHSCQGSGNIYQTACTSCHGKGKASKSKSLNVPIPAGVEDGQTVRMQSPEGKGNILISIQVDPSNDFMREGFDLHSDASVPFSTAILGGTVRVPGLNGPMKVKIPAGTQSHHLLRLPGKGIARLNNYGTGDHFVHVKIQIPRSLSSEQRKLIEEFQQTMEKPVVQETRKDSKEAEPEKEPEKEPGKA